MREESFDKETLHDALGFLEHFQTLDERHYKDKEVCIGVKLGDILEAHYRLGKTYFDKCDLDLSKQHFVLSLKFCQAFPPSLIEFKILSFLIKIAWEQYENIPYKDYISKAYALLEKSNWQEDPQQMPDFHYSLGTLALCQQKPQEAIKHFESAIGGLTSHGFQDAKYSLKLKALYAKASCFFFLGNFEQVLLELKSLEEIIPSRRKTYLVGAIYLLKGNTYSEMGELGKSLISYKRAKEVIQTKKCWNLMLNLLLGEGIIYKKQGEFSKALLLFEQVEKSVDFSVYKRLHEIIHAEINEIEDNSVDLYIDKKKRTLFEKSLGVIDFKHRFVLLEILFLLAKKPGVFFNKEDLAKEIWKDEYNPLVHDKLIYTSISRLRKLMEPKSSKRKYIIRGKDGYSFNDLAQVRFCSDSELEKFALTHMQMNSPI